MRDTYTFQRSLENDCIILDQVARIYLGDGQSVVRLLFTPDGLKMLISQSSIDSGYIKVFNDKNNLIEEIKTC